MRILDMTLRPLEINDFVQATDHVYQIKTAPSGKPDEYSGSVIYIKNNMPYKVSELWLSTKCRKIDPHEAMFLILKG